MDSLTSALEQSNRQVLRFLQCVDCGSANLCHSENVTQEWRLNFALASYCVLCIGCGQKYPVTDDDIPVMWSSKIREMFSGADAPESTVSTNAKLYDQMSDRYMRFTRQEQNTSDRIRVAVEQITLRNPTAEKLHLDWGCGPGHVLRWTEDLCTQRIGLDVSLANLRNARAISNTLVVLGDAENMPFADNVFDVVTESSVLHHIEDWRRAVTESCRVCRSGGGILFDSEPSRRQMNWSTLARVIFDCRWYVYHVLSYVRPEKHMFRDIGFARRNYWDAELHNQPGKGFEPRELASLLIDQDVDARIVMGPTSTLAEGETPNWKQVVLQLTSLQNPWNPQNANFLVVGFKRQHRDVVQG